MAQRTRLGTVIVVVSALAIIAVQSQPAWALRFGGVGNKPIQDPGWPAGAAVIFNTPSRIAYWSADGPWHAECRGDAKALSAVLAHFAKLEVKSKRLVVRNGVGRSYWLNANNDPAKRAAAAMDWSFMVWTLASGKQHRRLPADLNPTDPKDAEDGPPAQIDVYTGGNIKWEDVVVPQGLKVIDERLEAHGFTVADGIVLEGKVFDVTTRKPLGARMRLDRYDPKKGYEEVAAAVAGGGGNWVLTKAPAGSHRVVIEAPGYVARVAGPASFDQPGWHGYNTALAKPAPVSGRVLDTEGKPLADVNVRISDVAVEGGGHYQAPDGTSVKTDKDGRFRIAEVPTGKAQVWVHKAGYVRPGLGPNITTPTSDVELTMTRSARVEVRVDFKGKNRPQGYIVRIAPEGGEKIGSWGGSGHIDTQNQITYQDIPPGRYVLTGRPNPGSDNQETAPVTVDLKGGETTRVTLKAR
jgi:Carboxypeptidase regulatory-like domain